MKAFIQQFCYRTIFYGKPWCGKVYELFEEATSAASFNIIRSTVTVILNFIKFSKLKFWNSMRILISNWFNWCQYWVCLHLTHSINCCKAALCINAKIHASNVACATNKKIFPVLWFCWNCKQLLEQSIVTS